jgi:DUF971 family protein
MIEHESHITPTEINLHKKSRLLEIVFSDGSRFNYPCEYLRVFSPASLEQALDAPVDGKEMVDITSIEPQGTSLLQLDFNDGYTGSYSWNTLHELGVNYDRNWQASRPARISGRYRCRPRSRTTAGVLRAIPRVQVWSLNGLV